MKPTRVLLFTASICILGSTAGMGPRLIRIGRRAFEEPHQEEKTEHTRVTEKKVVKKPEDDHTRLMNDNQDNPNDDEIHSMNDKKEENPIDDHIRLLDDNEVTTNDDQIRLAEQNEKTEIKRDTRIHDKMMDQLRKEKCQLSFTTLNMMGLVNGQTFRVAPGDISPREDQAMKITLKMAETAETGQGVMRLKSILTKGATDQDSDDEDEEMCSTKQSLDTNTFTKGANCKAEKYHQENPVMADFIVTLPFFEDKTGYAGLIGIGDNGWRRVRLRILCDTVPKPEA